MTTIAYDTKSLVSDSQSTLSGEQIYEEDCQKIFPEVGPFAILAVAGNYQNAMDVIDVVKDYAKIDHILGLDFKSLGWQCSMLAITYDGKLWHYTGDKSFELRPDLPFAVGSGAEYALGAMAAGADAATSVSIASRFDLYTNNNLQVVDLSPEESEEPEKPEKPEESEKPEEPETDKSVH